MSRFFEKVASRVLGKEEVEAGTCCGGGCGYQYRCYGTLYQRRYCCSNCSCVQSCGSWQTIARNC